MTEIVESYDELRDSYRLLLKPYTKKAKEWMWTNRRIKFNKRYTSFQRTKIWKEAREIVIEYYKELRGHDKCSCGKEMNPAVMHHRHYHGMGWFDLTVVTIICKTCHARVHRKKWVNK